MARKKKTSQTAKTPAEDVIEAEVIETTESDEVVGNVAEDVSEAEPTPEPEELQVEETPKPASQRPYRGVAGPILGGVLAAVLGFGAAIYFGQGNWPFDAAKDEISVLQQQVDQQSQVIEELRAGNIALADQIKSADQAEELAALTERSSGQDGQIAILKTAVDKLASQVRDLENRPIPDVGATVEAVETYEAELNAMREMLAAELERIRSAQQNATSLNSELAERQAATELSNALEELRSLTDNGGGLDPTLSKLTGLGVDVAAMSPFADGVTPLADLQAEFPDLARSVMEQAIEEDIAAGRESKASGFLKAQLGIRTLGPKDGDTADAILSRAEGSLKRGNLDDALAELSSLSEATQALMAGWTQKATNRRDALNAVAELSAEIVE